MYRTLFVALLLTAPLACADQADPKVPYRLGQALVIGQEKGGRLTQVDESCDSYACQVVRERCGEDTYADVVLDESGEVADVLCFRGNVTVREIGPEAVPSAEAGNNTVLVLDDVDDGPDVTQGVVLAGNNAVVYGAGADVSVIGGGLSVEKNNAMVRGITIAGDVTIDKNNAQLSFVVIEGNLTLNGNNATLTESTVFGNLTVNGNNVVLVQNQLQGTDQLAGQNLTCNGNVRFDDADGDGRIEQSELGDVVACTGRD